MNPASDQKAGIVTILAGAALAVLGIALVARSRRQLRARAPLGYTKLEAKETHEQDGMTLRHFRHPTMPIRKRVDLLQDLVWGGVKDPTMRKLALQITKDCPARDGECEARAVYDWVRTNIRYTGDIAAVAHGANGPVEGVDLFQSPARTVEFGGGDCDDHSTLKATLLALNGIPARFRITGKAGPGETWSHIYVTAGLPKTNAQKWIPLDSTLPGERFAYEVPYGKARDFVV